MDGAATNPIKAEQPEYDTSSVGSSEGNDEGDEGWDDMDASPAEAVVGAAPDSPDAAVAGHAAAIQEAAASDEEQGAEEGSPPRQVSSVLYSILMLALISRSWD